MYNLPENYTHRLEPEYFDDVLSDSSAWQADVYALAAQLARDCDIPKLVDLGCGRAEKLLQYAADFDLIGCDYGRNIKTLQENHPDHTWVEFDLNNFVVSEYVFDDSIVICADVIEHLPTPDKLLKTLANAAKVAKYVLVSTPDRERVYKGEHYGPPGNPYHCREWTNAELVQWFRQNDLPVAWHGWTVSNTNRRDQVWTSLVILSKELIVGLPPVFEPAPINWDSVGIKHA